jgi:hypothetical protein
MPSEWKPPSWLGHEIQCPAPIPKPRDPKLRDAQDAAFVRAQFDLLRTLGWGEWQAIELVAIAAHETGYGRSEPSQVSNQVGLKIKRDVADWIAVTFGERMGYVTKAGHASSGDRAKERYCAFPNDTACWNLAAARMFGVPGTKWQKHIPPWVKGYREAAELLRTGDARWIDALIVDGGYRGSIVAGDPKRSSAAVAAHRSLVTRVRGLLAT